MFLRVLCIFVLLSSLLGNALPVQAELPSLKHLQAIKNTSPKIKIIEPTRVDKSQPLEKLAAYKINTPVERRTIPLGMLTRDSSNAPGLAPQADQAVQNTRVTGQMPPTVINFDGIDNAYSVAPPDTNGDIGPNHYVQWVNLGLQIWQIDRAAGTADPVLGPLDGNQLWAGYGGPCENDNDGDPVVLYDALADRWFLSQFAVTGGYYQCVAVSATPDPTGAYYRYAYNWGDKMNDYPKFGVWPDGYYMTANQFSGSLWGGAGVGVLERQKMLLGLKARLIQVDLYDVNRDFGGMLPADLDGNPPPAGTPGYFIEVDDSSYGLGTVDEMRIWEAVVDWDAAPPTLTLGQGDNFGQPSAILPVNNFNIICQDTRNCVPQADSTQSLDAIGDRLMFRLAYRYFAGEQPYEALVVNHTVLVNGRAGVRWYEVRRTAGKYSIYQQSTYTGDAPGLDTDYRWMGSIAMDWQGNMALGYSISSAMRHPSIAYTGRIATDPLNTLSRGEYIALSGSGSQSEINRWGDYSSMSVDPVDECTFWYTQEYTRGGWDWATRIMAFKMPTCPPQPGGNLRGNVSSSGSPVEGAVVSAGAYSTTSGTDGSYSFSRLPSGTYAVTVKAPGYMPAVVSSVIVTNGATTTQNFELTSLDTVTVTFQLVDGDGHTGLPLYGWIDITSPDTPESRIYTDPVTGQATAELFQDVLYSLTAQTENYQPASRSITYTASTAGETFALQTSALLGCPPGYASTEAISEGFESGLVPPDWYEFQLGGTSDGFTISPTAYQGAYSVFHDDYRVASESFDALVMPVKNLPANSTLEFFERENYSSYYNYHGVWVTTGSDPNPLVSTYAQLAELEPGSNGVWLRRQVDLSAYAGMDIFLAFYYKGNYSDEWNIDQVRVIESKCQVIAGGRVTGFVTDALNGKPLVGAKIESPSGTATSVATPEDTNIADGFYNTWSSPGAAAIRAGSAKYSTTSTNITITENAVHRQDFALSAGKVSVAPSVISTSVVISNTPVTMDLVIGNVGAVDLTYQLKEYYQNIAPVFQMLPSGPFAPNHRHVGPKNLNLPSLKDVVSYMAPVPAPMSADKAATFWDSNLAFPWGIGFNTTAGNMWLGNVLAGGGDNKNYRFTTAGVNTGDTIDISSWVGIFSADMTFNPYTGMFWQVNVGGDNCIYELDPQAKIPTGRKICPAFGTSERGLAYDPITGTFYAGSWNDGIINHFDSNGVILDSKDIGLNIAGLAFNPSTGHLFVSENDADATDIFVLDTNDNYEMVDAFNITGLDNAKQGIELDCQGQLWVVSTPYVFKTEPVERGVCTSLEIPWLSISPASGQAAADSMKPHQVTFNPTGLIPGEYTGYVGIFADTPYAPQVVEFHLTVTYVGRAYFPIIGR